MFGDASKKTDRLNAILLDMDLEHYELCSRDNSMIRVSFELKPPRRMNLLARKGRVDVTCDVVTKVWFQPFHGEVSAWRGGRITFDC